MEQLTLIKIHNPLSLRDRDIVPAPYQPGQTLLDLRNGHFPLMPVTVSVNGRVVSQEQLAVTYPLAGDQILFMPAVQGGDNLRMILMIVVAVIATVYAGPAGTSLAGSAWGGAVASGLTMVVGGMLVNALLPPPKPSLPTLDSLDNSQAYSWNPQTTQQQGVAIPKFYGTNKLYGNIITAYLYGTDDKQYANAIIGLGMGPIKRLYDFKINDQPMTAFQGVDFYPALGLLNETRPAPFNETKLEYPVSVKVEETAYIYTTEGNAFTKLEVELTFPQGIFYLADSGSLWVSQVQLRVSIRKQGDSVWIPITHEIGTLKSASAGYWSLGRWVSIGDPDETYWEESGTGGTDIYAHSDGSYYDIGIDGPVESGSAGWGTSWRWMGTMSSIADSVLDFVSVRGSQTTPLRKTYTADGLDLGAVYEIQIEKLSPELTSSRYGDDLYLTAVREVVSENFQYPRLAHFAVKALATNQLSGSMRFSCLAECAYVRVYDGASWSYDASENPAWCAFDVLTKPVIDMVRRNAAWAAATPYALGTYASSITENGYRYECTTAGTSGAAEPTWPTTAGNTVVDGTVTWTCRALSFVPDYYDAATHRYFRTVRYDGKDPALLDLVAWKDWADFCDDLAPDGLGGMEKRITFNGGFDTTTSTWEAAQQIAQLGRAIIVPTGSGYTVAVDKPGTPVQMFTVGNIGLDSFKERFLKKADRASSLTMDIVNRDNDYARDTFTVMLPNIPGTTSVSIPLIGCTKRSEAWRHGMYRLYNNLYINRAAELTVGIDAIACMKGDLVNIQHDVPQWGFGGRLITADANTATLDQAVTIEADKFYTLMVRLMDDTVVSRSVTNTPGIYTTLTVSSPFASVPAQYDPYAFGETTKVVKPFRVLNIKKSQDQECTLSLIEYNENIYGADAGLPVVPTQNYSSLEPLPLVTGLVLDELLVSKQDGGIDDVIDVFFTPPNSASYLEAEIWFSYGAGWRFAGSTNTDRFRISGVETNQTYIVAVATVNKVRDRMKIQNAPQESIATLGKLALPSDVTDFAAAQSGSDVSFSWTHIPDADRVGYEIRQGLNWESSRLIVSNKTSNRALWAAELNGTYRFLIKAIDSSGLYSSTAASVDITLTGVDENLNVILSQNEITKSGGPDGTLTNLYFVDTIPALMMPHTLLDTDVSADTDVTAVLTDYTGDITLSGEYESLPMDTLHIGDTWSRILAVIDVYELAMTDLSYPTRTDMSFPQDTDIHATMPVDMVLYLAYSDDDVTYTAWKLYTGTVQQSFRYVKIKLVVSIGSTTGVIKITSLLCSYDVLDQEYIIKGFAVTAATGDTLSFSTYGLTFYTAPTITAQLLSSLVNKVPNIVPNGTTGFHIDLYDKTDAKVAGTVDIRISGY